MDYLPPLTDDDPLARLMHRLSALSESRNSVDPSDAEFVDAMIERLLQGLPLSNQEAARVDQLFKGLTPGERPPIADVEAYVRWSLRYGAEFEAIRQSFFTEHPDRFVEVSMKHLGRELESLADVMPLYERYEQVSRFYETELVPLVRKSGGVGACGEDLKFTAIETYIRVIFINRFLTELDALAPPLTYGSVTPLPM